MLYYNYQQKERYGVDMAKVMRTFKEVCDIAYSRNWGVATGFASFRNFDDGEKRATYFCSDYSMHNLTTYYSSDYSEFDAVRDLFGGFFSYMSICCVPTPHGNRYIVVGC